MPTRAIHASASLLLGALLVSVAAGPAIAAQNEGGAKPPKFTEILETFNGVRYRMADSKVSEKITRVADAEGDQRTNEGEPAAGAPAHTDLVAVYAASGKMPTKLVRKMADDFPDLVSGGVLGSYYGDDADWKTGDPLVFVAAEMAARRPTDAPGQQLQIGLDGPAASALSVDSNGDPLIGLERFSLSGYFNNEAWGSGSTDVVDRAPFDDIPFYNTESGVFGYYDPRKATYFAIMPRSKAVGALTVVVRSSTEQGEVVDQLTLPAGGQFIDLRAPGAGFSKKSGLPALTCRAIETYSAESGEVTVSEAGATQILYTAGLDAAADQTLAAELLAEVEAAGGSIPMLLTPVGSDAEPITIVGALAMAPDVAAMTLTMEVPAGRWAFAPADGPGSKTPTGERLIDHLELTGSAGVVTGPGLDGVVVGDPLCGLDDLGGSVDPEEDAEDEG